MRRWSIVCVVQVNKYCICMQQHSSVLVCWCGVLMIRVQCSTYLLQSPMCQHLQSRSWDYDQLQYQKTIVEAFDDSRFFWVVVQASTQKYWRALGWLLHTQESKGKTKSWERASIQKCSRAVVYPRELPGGVGFKDSAILIVKSTDGAGELLFFSRLGL